MTLLPPGFSGTPLPGIGRRLTDQEAILFYKYLNLLTKWQKTQRLIGSLEPAWVIEHIFIGSLCFLEALPDSVSRVADVGSGAGIPGIPIAIVRPDLEIGLIEPRQRRVSFLSTVVRELSLFHVTVIAGRVEQLGESHAGVYDAVVMRCTAKLDTVLDDALRLTRRGGALVVAASPSLAPPLHGDVVRIQTPSGLARVLHRFWKY